MRSTSDRAARQYQHANISKQVCLRETIVCISSGKAPSDSITSLHFVEWRYDGSVVIRAQR